MTVALYATIWIALAAFAAAEAAKRRAVTRGTGLQPCRWAWPLFASGAALCAIHFVLAFAGPYQWSHAIAVRETARLTQRVYGVAWGGGVYVNYLFLAAWIGEAWWWRRNPSGYFARPLLTMWLLRAFYLLIIVNAAVVFARPAARPFGVALVGTLLWAWHRTGVNQTAPPHVC